MNCILVYNKNISEKFFGENGVPKNINDVIYFDINGRTIWVSRTGEKQWELFKENNTIKNGTIETVYETSGAVISHLRKLITNSYNEKLKQLGIKNPEQITYKGYKDKINQIHQENSPHLGDSQTAPQNTIKQQTPTSIKTETQPLEVKQASIPQEIPIGKRGGHIEIDGINYTWSEKNQYWFRKNPNNPEEILIKKPTPVNNSTDSIQTTEPPKSIEYKQPNTIITKIENTQILPEKIFIPNNQQAIRQYISDNWNHLKNNLPAIGALLTLARKQGYNPLLPIPELPENPENMTPEQVAEVCIQCLDGALSNIDFQRPSAANEKIILEEKRRNSISKKWTKTKQWKDVVEEWTNIRQDPPEGLKDDIINTINQAMENPIVHNIQELQRCIGMDSVDNADSQDGILGPRTTKKLKDFLISIKKH